MSDVEDDLPTEEIDSEDLENMLIQAIEGSPPGWGPTSLVYFGPKNRSILLSGDIDQALSDGICSQIHELASQSSDTITVYINTPGGSVVDALAIYDLLKCVDAPIITVVNGACYSAGLIILAAGDLRLATPHSTFFYHQPIMSNSDVFSTETLNFMVQTYQWSQKHLDSVIRKRAGLSNKKWEKHFKNRTAKHFGVKRAIKYGLIDEVLKYSSNKGKLIIDRTDDG